MRYENMHVGSFYKVIRLVGCYAAGLTLSSGPTKKVAVGMLLKCTRVYDHSHYQNHSILELTQDGKGTGTHYECNHHGVLQLVDTHSIGNTSDRETEQKRLTTLVSKQTKDIKSLTKQLNVMQTSLTENKLRLENLSKYESDAEALVTVLKDVNTKDLNQADVVQLLRAAGINIA